MLQKMRGIVLRTLKYKDTSVIADLYTEETGRTSFLVSVPRSAKRAAVKPSLFQSLAILEIEADIRPHASIHRLKEVKTLSPFATLPYDPRKRAIALFLAEFLCRALREEAANRPLFAYLRHSLEWLDTCADSRFANFHLVFLMHLSRFLGLYPDLRHYQEGYCFDLRGACFLPSPPPLHADYLAPAEASHLLPLMRMDYPTMHLFPMSRQQRGRCLDLILHYYRLHLPAFPPLNSVEVLQSLFD